MKTLKINPLTHEVVLEHYSNNDVLCNDNKHKSQVTFRANGNSSVCTYMNTDIAKKIGEWFLNLSKELKDKDEKK